MHRIDTPTAQKDKFGAGKNGFTRGNPQTGTPATDLDDDYCDSIQEELAGIVEASGVTLDKADRGQVLKALKVLFSTSSDSLGALAALVGAANKLPYFTGPKAAALADLTAFAREILAQTDAAGVLSKLGLGGVSSIREAVFTASGSWTCPAGITKVLLDGSGGGGGGACGASSAANGNGGGGAASVTGQLITVVPGTVYTITVGNGGAGGTSSTPTGGDGGTSSFGTLVSLPGGGGGSRTAVGAAGGSGGIPGQEGYFFSNVSFSGCGGGSTMGGGGGGAQATGTGQTPGQYGGGGGAGVGGSRPGGNGANGIIRFSW